MNPETTIALIESLGVTVEIFGSQPRYSCPPGMNLTSLQPLLDAYRQEIVEIITKRNSISVDDLTADEVELWNERAAIREFDGEMDRQTAERLALGDVLRHRRRSS